MRAFLVAVLLLFALAAPASAAFPDNSALLFASPGDVVTGGIPRVYDDTNATFTLTGTAGDATLHVAGTNGSSATLEFAAKRGSLLQPGVYKNVERAAFRSANRGGMDVNAGGTGCSTVSGWFEVKDLAVDSSGQIVRLQILYEQHCDGLAPATFGEVRYGEPGGVTPSELRLPATQFGQPTAQAGIALLSSTGATVASATISGSAADDFAVSFANCTGSDPCPPPTGFGVTFDPRSTGTRSATAHVTDSNGAVYDVPLRGSTYR
jgi:hypothetical protein